MEKCKCGNETFIAEKMKDHVQFTCNKCGLIVNIGNGYFIESE